MDDRSPVVRALATILGVVAAGVAVAVFAPSAPTARALLGLRDPGDITTFGGPAVTAVGYIVVALAVGSVLFAAFFVPPQTDGLLDIGGYRALRWAATFFGVWVVCSVAMIVLSVSNLVGKPVRELLTSGDFFTAYSTVSDAYLDGDRRVRARGDAVRAVQHALGLCVRRDAYSVCSR